MIKRLASRPPDFLILTFLILILVVDAISKIILVQDPYSNHILPNRLLKAGIVVVCLLYYSLNGINKSLKRPILLVAVFLIFVASTINFFLFDIGLDYPLKYMFLIVIIPLFYFQGRGNSYRKRLDRILRVITIVNLVCIIAGYLFSLKVFQTYVVRFGFDGLVITPMQATYLYIFLLVFFFKKNDLKFFFLCFISSILVGTKLLWGFSFIMLMLFVWRVLRGEIIRVVVLVAVVVLFILVIVFFFSQEQTIMLLEKKGIWSVLFSTRNDSFSRLISNWDSLNFNLFTGGVDLSTHRTEFELIDLFLCYGFFGLVAYVLIFKKLFSDFIISPISRYLIVVVFIGVMAAGNFLYYPINCFFLMLILSSLYDYDFKNCF